MRLRIHILHAALCLLVTLLPPPAAGWAAPAASPLEIDYRFTHYTTANSDLPYNMVNEIVQDDRGFIWFGTSSGLCRFDGTRFRNFSKEELGLKSPYVIALSTDARGNLWVGTDLGVTVYNAELDRFEPFDRPSDLGTTIHNKANYICRGPDGRIWISVNHQGIFVYDPADDSLRNYFFEEGRQTLPVNIRSLYVDDANGIWISLFYNSLYRIAPGEPIPATLQGACELKAFRDDNVTAICASPADPEALYVASVKKGLCRLDRRDGSLRSAVPPSASRFSPEDLSADRSGCIWMSTNEGVYIYDPATQAVRRLAADPRDRFSLSDSHAFAVLFDDSDGLWIGTNVGGVNYCGAFQRNFEKLYLADGRSLGDCLVRGFADDRAGRIYVATEMEGLLVYDTEAHTLRRATGDKLPAVQFAACYDDGMVWLGTLNGLYRYDTRTGRARAYERLGHPASMQDQRVFTVFRAQAGAGRLFVGTTVGLYCYDPQRDTFDRVEGFEGQFVTGIDEDADGVLWVSTYASGLISYNLRSECILDRYTSHANHPWADSLPSDKLFSVLAGSGDLIWMTSFNGGFFSLDKRSGRVRIYDTAHCDYLPTDIILKIVEDNGGRLWISSDKGLFSLDPQTDELHRFTIYDGLLDEDFKNCGLKTASGDLYFGSRSGFIRFNPEHFAAESGTPRLTITDLRVGDERVAPAADGSSPLTCSVDRAREIHLAPRQNSFGFEFALSGARSPGRVIACTLVGYDEAPRRVAADNTIFYYNVPAGRYTLRIEGINGSGKSFEPRELTIVVAEYFYKSPLAIAGYVLLITAIVVGCSALHYRRAMRRQQRKHEEYKQQKELELFQQKLSFFSSVVHEIKTPLTVLRAPLQHVMASEQLDAAAHDELRVIANSTDYLDRLVRELLDFIRVERRGYELEPVPFDLAERVGFLCSNFAETAKARNLRLYFAAETERIGIEADKGAMDKILNNLLHNAVKYAESWIRVTAVLRDGCARVSVSNDGPMITPERRTEIFKPFVQYSHDADSTPSSFGIGLPLARSLAEMHGGTLELADDPACTTFVLTLPAREAAEPGVQPAPAAEPAQGPLLLLVEDNREFNAYLERKLSADYRVLAARSAERACTLLHEHEIDLIVTDIALPGMSGIELCRTVASDFELSHIPVIVISAISATDTKITCIEAGASTYIEKPFSLEYLCACIKGILDKRASLKKAYRTADAQVDPQQFNLLSADEEFLRRLDELIMQNLNDPQFSSRQIEEALFLSRSTLIRKVRALLNTTPNDYLRFKRLSVAAQLLSTRQCRISEVCFAVGFNSPSYFSKCFREQFGILPAEYQKK